MTVISVLSTAFKKETGSNNKGLLDTFTDELETCDLDAILDAQLVNTAADKSLEYLVSLVNLRREEDETDEHLRARFKLTIAIARSGGTIPELKEIMAAALQTATHRITIEETWGDEPATFEITVYLADLLNAGLTIEELQELLDTVKPAGVRVNQGYLTGTFTYRGIVDEDDATKGYNNIANGNPTGGTYSGLVYP